MVGMFIHAAYSNIKDKCQFARGTPLAGKRASVLSLGLTSVESINNWNSKSLNNRGANNMQRKGIKPREFVQDFRRGLSDVELMDKYQISARGLQTLLSKLMNKGILTSAEMSRRSANTNVKRKQRRINVREFAEDVQLGLDDNNLMLKYDLNQNQLSIVLQRLLETNLLSEAELYNRLIKADTMVIGAITDAQKAIDELG